MFLPLCVILFTREGVCIWLVCIQGVFGWGVWADHHPYQILWDPFNERVVRILLKGILVCLLVLLN